MPISDLFDLSGKVAVITGGAGGIGTVYATALCEAGAAVLVADLNAAAAEAAAATLADKGYRAAAVEVDVSSAESAAAMAAAAVDAFGGIDILVNNAAIMTDLPTYGLSNMPVPEWDRVFNVNLRGPLLCTQAVLESMTARGGGRIVNAIAPGLVDNESGYLSLAKDSPLRQALYAGIPGKKSGPPEDLVGTLLLLCSKAGEWITGQTMLVDGGWMTRL